MCKTTRYLLFLLILLRISVSNLIADENHPKIKICLNMIVKNESHIIERCLNSVKNIVDYISICDTGSSDNTIEIIEQFMQTNNIPGKIYRQTWINFGHNRSLSFQAAQKSLQELGFFLPNTYLLLLDADMILEVDPSFKQTSLTADAYYIRQRNHTESCHNIRLIRSSLPWECSGVTHEYWLCNQPTKIEQLQALQVDDREDGGCKADKYERDIKLLTETLRESPNHSRSIFYLAQSYRALGNFDEAIKWYKARIPLKGSTEEVWYSKLMIGKIYEELGFWTQALHYYLDAYHDNPKRAEPLYKIAQHYRINGQNQLAYLFAKEGSNLTCPSDPLLFVLHPVYDYQLDEEISIAAYYTPFKKEGFEAISRLILNKSAPRYVKDCAYKNLLFYIENLKDARFQPLEIETPLIREGLSDRYNPMNTSILKTENGYLLICRTVNFNRNLLSMISKDPLDPTMRTRNFLIECDSNFNIQSQKEIIENFPREENHFPFNGLDDCRLFSFNQQPWFACATFGTHPNIIGQTLCKLADHSSDKTIDVEKFIPLKVPDPKRFEKNWLPFIKNNKLHAIYFYDPFTVYELNMQTGNYEKILQVSSTYDFSRFRGSAAPIEFDDGYLMLVHEVVGDQQLYYLHRFVFLDKDLNIKKLSKSFMFKHKGIEFCTGMTIDHSGTQCILPFSIEEREAWICSVPIKTIRSLLEPLP